MIIRYLLFDPDIPSASKIWISIAFPFSDNRKVLVREPIFFRRLEIPIYFRAYANDRFSLIDGEFARTHQELAFNTKKPHGLGCVFQNRPRRYSELTAFLTNESRDRNSGEVIVLVGLHFGRTIDLRAPEYLFKTILDVDYFLGFLQPIKVHSIR